MMNEQTTEMMGYDPSDLTSFPYQADDPPFGPHRLKFEDVSAAQAAELDVFETITELSQFPDDSFSNYRQLDMALRLFQKLASDPLNAYEGLPYPNLFAACCAQAMIWERG